MQQTRIASTQDDIVGLDRGSELFYDAQYVPAPFLLSQTSQASGADVVFIGAPLFVRQVREFHNREL